MDVILLHSGHQHVSDTHVGGENKNTNIIKMYLSLHSFKNHVVFG